MPKGQRRKKDPNKPKRGKSAFLLFSQYTRPAVVAEMPELAFPDVAREVARRWKLIDPEEKKELEKKAAADRERYNEEMKLYVPPPDLEGTGKRGKKKKKEGPKRNVSSFMWFCKENRSKAKVGNPEASMTGISSILGKQWNAMGPEEREPFEKLARADKERYLRESKLFQETKAKAMAELAAKQEAEAQAAAAATEFYDDGYGAGGGDGGEGGEYYEDYSGMDNDYDVVW